MQVLEKAGVFDASLSHLGKLSHLTVTYQTVWSGIMSRHPGLWLRGSVWQYRTRIPSDLCQSLGRIEVNRSLKTSSYAVAVREARRVGHELDRWFDSLRNSAGKPEPDSGKLLHIPVTHWAPPMPSTGAVQTMPAVPVAESPTGPATGLTVGQLYERYMADPAIIRSPKTVLTYEGVYAILLALLGKDASVKAISRETCRQVLDVIRSLPPNATKRFPKCTPVQAAKLAKERGLETLSPTSINKYISKLGALLNWAMKEGYIDRNPAVGLRVADPIRARDKRQPFDDHQLQVIFGSEQFSGYRDSNPSRYWIPLIGLFSGMRLNEICQLEVADVRTLDGVFCFVVTIDSVGDNVKRLKTSSAERVVPVHPVLMEIGFGSFVRSRPGPLLFPEIKPGSTGYRSDTFSKWFARDVNAIGAHRDRTSFHSFRHNFRDALREAEVRHDISLALGGWADDVRQRDETHANYGRGYKATTLLDAIQRVRYPALDGLFEGCRRTTPTILPHAPSQPEARMAAHDAAPDRLICNSEV